MSTRRTVESLGVVLPDWGSPSNGNATLTTGGKIACATTAARGKGRSTTSALVASDCPQTGSGVAPSSGTPPSGTEATPSTIGLICRQAALGRTRCRPTAMVAQAMAGG